MQSVRGAYRFRIDPSCFIGRCLDRGMEDLLPKRVSARIVGEAVHEGMGVDPAEGMAAAFKVVGGGLGGFA